MLLRLYFSSSVRVRVNIAPFLMAFETLDRALTLFLIPSVHLKLQVKKDKYTTLAHQLQKDLLAYQMDLRNLSVLKIPNNQELLFYGSVLGLLAQSVENIIRVKGKCNAKDIFKAFSQEPFLEVAWQRTKDVYLKQASQEALQHLKRTYTTAYKEDHNSFVEILAQSVPDLCFAQYAIENQCYYLHFERLKSYSMCSSCGKLMPRNTAKNEYFCSQECVQTEQICTQISNILNPYLENQDIMAFYKKLRHDQEARFQRVTELLSGVSINNIMVAQNWVELYRSLSHVQPFFKVEIGHDDMAKILNNYADLNAGKNARIVEDDRLKGGADRLINGVEVQSKYYNTPKNSLDAYFYNEDRQGNHVMYLDRDGKPMCLEVPKDQYNNAVELIREGAYDEKLANLRMTREEFITKKLRAGNVTLQEAKHATKFCTKESLKFDAQRGAVVAISAFGVSFVCNSAFLLFRGKSIQESLKSALFASTASAGKAFLVSMIAMQAQRTVLKSFLERTINFNFHGNFIGRGLAELGRRGAGAASKNVINSSANSVIRSNVIVAGATMLVTSGIEVTQMARGKISGMQCMKNIATNAVGVTGGMSGAMAGATLGTMLMPGIGTGVGAFVGGITGGLVGTKLGKSFMDKFIEDDLVKVYRLFFWYIQYLALLFRMNEREMQAFKTMIDITIERHGQEAFFRAIRAKAQQTLPHINAILKPMAVIVVSSRPKIPPMIFDRAHAEQVSMELLQEMV